MKKKVLLVLFSLFLAKLTFAQDVFNPNVKGTNDTIKVAVTRAFDGQYIPWIPLLDVPITSFRTFSSEQARKDYLRLRYNVLKVLPYARFARSRYARLHDDLANTQDRKEQKRLVKTCEREIKDMFNREVKNLTISQGAILIKLIDRETGNSSYDLVRQLKGGVTAFFYQSVARIFGHNLKQTYDPQSDRDIENIIQKYGYYNSTYGYN